MPLCPVGYVVRSIATAHAQGLCRPSRRFTVVGRLWCPCDGGLQSVGFSSRRHPYLEGVT